MRKLFLVALAGMTFASCSNHDDWFDTEKYAAEKHEAKVKEYTAAFVSEFGTPAPGHNWGFGPATRSVATRSANTDGKFWFKNGYDNIPPADTKDYEAAVTEIFRDKEKWEKYKVEGIDFSDFFVQQVHKGASDVCTYTSYKDGNGTTHQVYGPDKMDQLVCQKKDGTKEHVNNFNNAEFSGGNWNQEVWNGQGGEDGYNNQDNLYRDAIILMQDSGTDAFGWSNSNEQGYFYMDAYMIIEYPENSGYYYVGFDYYRRNDGVRSDNYASKENEIKNKQTDYDNNSANWDEQRKASALAEIERLQAELAQYADCYKNGDQIVDRDYRYDDWIIRVTPAKKTVTEEPKEDTSFQVWCEDLGGEYQKGNDFDFNDVVLNFKKVDGGTEVWLEAAGGTMAIEILWNNESLGEVHDKLGVAVTDMVNTGKMEREPVCLVKFNSDVTPEIVKNALVIKVQDAETSLWYNVSNGQSQAPQMIVCAPGLKWPAERQSIKEAYPTTFENWVTAGNGQFTGK